MQLSGDEVRLALFLEAEFRPQKPLIAGHKRTRRLLSIGDATLSNAKAKLLLAGIIVCVRPAVRPGLRNGVLQVGRAAEFDLPHRHTGPLPARTPWLQGANIAYQGSWRVSRPFLLEMVTTLEAPAALIMARLHACDHSPKGAISRNEPRIIRDEEFRLPRSTCARGISQLVDFGLLDVAERGAGRRPSTYRLSLLAMGGA